MRCSPSLLPLVLSLSMVLTAGPAAGAAGDLDPSFGDGGKVITKFLPIGGGAYALAIQPDGKIVVGGVVPRPGGHDFTLVRYLLDGSLDASFGTGGRVTTVFPGRSSEVLALALQPDGKIVAAGAIYGTSFPEIDFALARYGSDGSLDASFGSGGLVATSFGGIDRAYGVAVLPDGRIVAAGSVGREGGGSDFAVALYNAGGTLDTGFGAGGRVETDFFGLDDSAQAVVVQPDGRIIAVGLAFSAGATRVALARYNLDGSLDASFGGDGKVTSDSVPFSAIAFAAALQPDGRIVVGGTAVSASFDFFLARFHGDGSPDTGFGAGGWTTLDFFGQHDEAHAVALQPDGGIVVAGFAQSGPEFKDYDFALARYTVDGILDTSFGTAGLVTTDFFGLADQGYAAASQPDGGIVVAGFATDSDRLQQFALARYLSAVNAPPVITGAAASRTVLWPPNHKMIDVTVSYQVSDDRDPAPSCALSVTSDEPVDGTGDGDTAPDWQVVDAHRVRLRAERSGRGDGRTYTIVITCTDSAGAAASEAVTVGVSLNQGRR